MAYSCSTCGKTHKTGHICKLPIPSPKYCDQCGRKLNNCYGGRCCLKCGILKRERKK